MLFWTCLELCSSLSQWPSPSGLFSREQSFTTIGTQGDRTKSTCRVPSKQLLCWGSNTRDTHTDGLRPRKNWERKTTRYQEHAAGRARTNCS